MRNKIGVDLEVAKKSESIFCNLENKVVAVTM